MEFGVSQNDSFYHNLIAVVLFCTLVGCHRVLD